MVEVLSLLIIEILQCIYLNMCTFQKYFINLKHQQILVNGFWTSWSSWSLCPICGYQNIERHRSCSIPQYGGLNCSGDWSEAQICPIPPCPGRNLSPTSKTWMVRKRNSHRLSQLMKIFLPRNVELHQERLQRQFTFETSLCYGLLHWTLSLFGSLHDLI